MATFNTKAEGMKTTNRCGHAAYKLAAREELMSEVLTSFVCEPKFYGDTTPRMVELARELARIDGLFVAKLALYARTVMNMRSSSHVLCAVLAHEVKGERFVRQAVRACVVRGDDVTEMLAAYFALFPGEALPNSLRRGLRDALDAMDDYSLAKYRMEGRTVTMADAVKLCHPHRREATRALLEGDLAKPMSWETELSAHGNTAEVWERLLAEDAVPYMALLRNLRNLLRVKPANFDLALERLADPAAVAKSRQLPFRFWSAYKSVEQLASGKTLAALSRALDASVANYPTLRGRTVVAVDVSGSMDWCTVSEHSSVKCSEVAMMLAACLVRLSEDCWMYAFSDDAWRVPVVAGASVLDTMKAMEFTAGCTNPEAVFEAMERDGVDCDRVVFLSDFEVNRPFRRERGTLQTCADRLRKRVGHRVWLHAFDMAGFGTTQFAGSDTTFAASWSDKLLSFAALAEAGMGSMVDAVDALEVA